MMMNLRRLRGVCFRGLHPALAALSLALALAGCSNVEKAGPQPTPSPAQASVANVPRIMQGTVASEAVILGYPQAGNWGYADIVVRGYGLVVGLDGTGSGDIPAPVRAHMRAEMARRGVGRESIGYGHLSPEEMLNSPDTSVVIVEAVIPPGAVEDTRFDVRVFPIPESGTTSLEGGLLYTTELRPGPLNVGRAQPFTLAEARGPVFINPFAEPTPESQDFVERRVGRVLNGGVVKRDMPLKLRLLTPGHTRARHVQNAINTRFPRERGQGDETARGESDELIEITVPPSWHGRTDEFVALLQHTTIRQTRPEAVALSVRRALESDPGYASSAALRWEALGQLALPIVQQLYDHAEELIRMAALAAGARLDDPLVTSHLIRMGATGSFDARRQAIELLRGMRMNPQIDSALRALLDDQDVELRLAAYEALAERGDPFIRRVVVDDKFVLDLVDSQRRLVYITQLGQPRIVLFGQDLAVQQPLTMRAWSNRLMMKSEDDGRETIELYYREPSSPEGSVYDVEAALPELISFLAHRTTVEAPAPGLGLSYGETVGAIHQIWRQGHLNADFKAEQDRILAAIQRRELLGDVPERPEFSTVEEDGAAEPDAPLIGEEPLSSNR